MMNESDRRFWDMVYCAALPVIITERLKEEAEKRQLNRVCLSSKTHRMACECADRAVQARSNDSLRTIVRTESE